MVEHSGYIGLAVFWLWLVAGCTFLDSVASGAGHRLRIPFGLSVAGLFDANLTGNESPEKRFVPILTIAGLVVIFFCLGFMARGLKRWPYVIGGVLYFADMGFAYPDFISDITHPSLSFHTFRDILAVAFHFAGIFFLFNAAYRLSVIKKLLAMSLPNESSEPTPASVTPPVGQEPRSRRVVHLNVRQFDRKCRANRSPCLMPLAEWCSVTAYSSI